MTKIFCFFNNLKMREEQKIQGMCLRKLFNTKGQTTVKSFILVCKNCIEKQKGLRKKHTSITNIFSY